MTEEIKVVPQVETERQLPEIEEKVYFRGKELKLKYTLWSLIQLQEEFNLKIDELADEGEMDFSKLVKIVWAGLQDEYEDVTFKEVAQAFDIGEVKAVSAELNRAMASSTAVGKPAISAGLASA